MNLDTRERKFEGQAFCSVLGEGEMRTLLVE